MDNIKYNVKKVDNFTLDDLSYVYLNHSYIKKTYNFLKIFHMNRLSSEGASGKISLTDYVKKHRMSTRTGKAMRELELIDDNGIWLHDYPTNGDAIVLCLKIRELSKKARK